MAAERGGRFAISLPQLTLFGRSLLLFLCEIVANAVCWVAAGVLFGRNEETQSILSLALLAWTLGLRHALDADHISAIDNATRGLINLGQLPVTCGLFFSLGHSTIVVAVTVAIAISSGVYERMQKVGDVGGIIGASVSGLFLFVIGVANTIVLWQIIRRRRREKALERRQVARENIPEPHANDDHPESRTLMMRILGPVVTFVNKPWKMYPVGVLFGLGFDTASSIALLSIAALGKRDANGMPIPSSHIVILPLLFTSGMTLIDSADSILMLFSYSGFPEKSWKIFTSKPILTSMSGAETDNLDREKQGVECDEKQKEERVESKEDTITTKVKLNVMSELSIILTLMSILVAFAISLITIMGLVGENCRRCMEAAEADNGHGGGLAGRWWRAWASASNVSEYIGAAIVGVFLMVVVFWYTGRWTHKRFKK